MAVQSHILAMGRIDNDTLYDFGADVGRAVLHEIDGRERDIELAAQSRCCAISALTPAM
jgi:hypothetical protein